MNGDDYEVDGSGNHDYVDKYYFDMHHEYVYAYAQQCFRLALVTNVMPLYEFAFIEDPAVEDYVLSAVYQMPLKNYIFDFDKDNEEHMEWAIIAMEIGFWGYETSDGENGGRMEGRELEEYCVGEAEFHIQTLRENLEEEERQESATAS